jgi:nucleoside-diphosphate-sugar epimerase
VSRILVTGASGFVGRALVAALARAGHRVRAAARTPAALPDGVEAATLPNLADPVDWQPLLAGCEIVIHLAGIAHTGAAAAHHDQVNRAATAALAQACADAGIGRLVFVSSVRAQCGPSAARPLRETDPPQPTDPYGASKLAAEAAVRATGVPFTILRPVLVYGPEPKGNLAQLMRLAASPCWLPFGAFDNRRSLIGLDNLIAALELAAISPAMAGATYLAADPDPLTVAEMLSTLRAALGRPPRLIALPRGLIAQPLRLIGRSDLWQRLGGSLTVDPGRLLSAGWRPVNDTRAGLIAMAQAAAPRKSGTASRSTR